MDFKNVILGVVIVLAGIHLFLLLRGAKRHKDDAATLNKLKQELDNSDEGSNSYEYSLYRFVAEYLMQKDNGIVTGIFLHIKYCNFIDRKKINNARRRYAHFKSDNEIPLIMIDVSLFKNGGIIITTHGIYCMLAYQEDEYKPAIILPWTDINEIKLVLKKDHAVLVINDNTIGKTYYFKQGNSIDEKECVVFNELMLQLQKKVKQHLSILCQCVDT